MPIVQSRHATKWYYLMWISQNLISRLQTLLSLCFVQTTGAPKLIFATQEYLSLIFIQRLLFERYDLNQFIESSENLTADISSVIWQKGESQNGGNKNTKHAKFPEKRTFFNPCCAYQAVKNVHFSKNVVRFVFLLSPFWDSPFCHITGDM